VFTESPPRRQRALLAIGVIFTAGLGILLAFASHPARANLTDTTTESAPTTTFVPTPDPAPTPAPKPTSVPKKAPAAKKRTPAPSHRSPATRPTSSATPSIHAASAPVRATRSVPKQRHVHQRRRHRHVKQSIVPRAAASPKSPGPVKVGVAGARVERTAIASSATTGHGVAVVFLLVGLLFGALLLTIVILVPASAARFTLPGRVVIQHQLDLAILGLAMVMLTLLVYALGTTGP
jgi:hypothetical protein